MKVAHKKLYVWANNFTMEVLFLILGTAVGGLLVWLWLKLKGATHNPLTVQLEQLTEVNNQLHIDLQTKAKQCELLEQQLSTALGELKGERARVLELSSNLASQKADYMNLQQTLAQQQADMENLQQKFTDQFNNLANKIFEEKSQKFTLQNKENLDQVLKPLNEKLKDFEKKVEDTYHKSLKDSTDLQAEIKKLFDLNSRISQDANNLTRALKGDVKKQGNWGEVVLERILESSGLQKDREYKTQVSFGAADGTRSQPDVIIYLPENKHIIVDAKVSLVAYDNLVNATEPDQQEAFLKEHVRSIRAHIKELSQKQYHALDGLNTPEYVLLFLPIEASFGVAVQQDRDIFNYAWENKIVVVSPSTLVATLMTIASIWRQENQTRNALEIAQKGGALYDKFHGLVEDLLDLGKKMKSAQDAYQSSMNKLVDGRGNLITRAEELRTLGAKAGKVLPRSIIDRANDSTLTE